MLTRIESPAHEGFLILKQAIFKEFILTSIDLTLLLLLIRSKASSYGFIHFRPSPLTIIIIKFEACHGELSLILEF